MGVGLVLACFGTAGGRALVRRRVAVFVDMALQHTDQARAHDRPDAVENDIAKLAGTLWNKGLVQFIQPRKDNREANGCQNGITRGKAKGIIEEIPKHAHDHIDRKVGGFADEKLNFRKSFQMQPMDQRPGKGRGLFTGLRRKIPDRTD